MIDSTIIGLAVPIGLTLSTPIGEAIGVRWLFVLMGMLGGLVSLLGFVSPAMLNTFLRAYGCGAAASGTCP